MAGTPTHGIAFSQKRLSALKKIMAAIKTLKVFPEFAIFQ